MYWVVQCVHCGKFMVYLPRKQITRRRKKCVYCKTRFTIQAPKYEVADPKEAAALVRQLHEYPNTQVGIDPSNPAHKKLRKQHENAQSRPVDFSHKYPGGHWPRVSPNTQRTKTRVEVDWTHRQGVIPVEGFGKIGGLPEVGIDEDYVIRLKGEWGSLRIYSSGLVDMYLDTSTGLKVAQAEGVIQWIEGMVGQKLQWNPGGVTEYTIEAPCESELAGKIAETLPPQTNLALIEGVNKVKIYRKGAGCPAYRVETWDHLTAALQAEADLLKKVLPDMTRNERIFLLRSEVHAGELQAIKEGVGATQQVLQTVQGQTEGTTGILGELSQLQAIQTQNLVQLTRFMDMMQGQVQEVQNGITDLVINGGARAPYGSRKLHELQAVLDFVGSNGRCGVKAVCAQFGWSNGKASRMLNILVELGELERKQAAPTGRRGRPRYEYQPNGGGDQ